MDNKASQRRVSWPALRIVRFSRPALTERIERRLIQGVRVRVFGAAKTVADCFKYRNKIGVDVAIEAGGSGNGYRFAELGPANNPSGWAGVLKVRTPAGASLGYILLYSNP